MAFWLGPLSTDGRLFVGHGAFTVGSVFGEYGVPLRMAKSALGVALGSLLWGRYLVKQIGGVTGDVAGALIEVSEVISLGLWQSVWGASI
jgi:cobalamin synthase